MIFSNEDDIKMEAKLKERIEDVYRAYKERDFEKFIKYDMPNIDKKVSRKENIEEIKNTYPILINYNIKEITIAGDKAKVKVSITVKLENVNDVSDSFDYWVYQDNEWYLADFGKIQ